MTRYFRAADALNGALDVGENQAFSLDLGDGNGAVKYPGAWPRQDLVNNLGFTAYEPTPLPPPPSPLPETTPLSRRQFWDWINGKHSVTKAQIQSRIDAIANVTQRVRAQNYVDHESFMDWNDPFMTWVRGQLTAALGITDADQRVTWMQVANEEWT